MFNLWHRHIWSKWVTVEEGESLLVYKHEPSRPPIKTGTYLIQQRTCATCDYKQLRTVNS